ncbi:MAG: argininosuccinate lyase [Ignavibacteriae bacterium HGW-Ignavibacteriae-3]|nr:MAG: argininosuccinate lyase [Ignavibacteriae bacterium HGW-Ignavibacteriae-3]
MALWDSRFKKSLADVALKFSSSIDIDGRFYNEDIDGSKAHVQMLMKQRIISAGDGKAILKALEEIRKDITSGKIKFSWRDEDIHSLVEGQLVRKLGERGPAGFAAEAGKRLHTARSRNDQVALDERLYMRKELVQLVKLTRTLQKTLLKKAVQYKDTVIPGYTHLQRAQPLMFAHHLIAYISMLNRDVERLADCTKRANISPLGAAALAGTTLNIDRYYSAKLLKMNGIIENSLDAVSDRDVMIELISACSIIMMHLSRLSEELVLWNSQEFSFAQFDDSFSTGSSLMPQKKNPDIAELIRGKVGRVYGSLFGLLTIMKALPLAYNRDMQEDKVHFLDALDTTKDCLHLASELLKNTKFKKDRFEKELDGDLLLSTDLVDYLVRRNVPFRKAHNIVGNVVALCVEKNKKLNGLTLKEYKKFSPEFEKDVFNLLTARASVKNKKSQGSTSYVEVQKQINFWKKKLS